MKRSSWSITAAVLRALILREAVARMFSSRAALFWLLAEPAAYIGFIALIMGSLRARVIGGMPSVVWLSTGLLAFFLFRRTGTQGAAAIGSNQALYTYRQVLPVDTVIARCVLEGLLMLMIAVIIIGAVVLIGSPITLDDPLLLGASCVGLWLLGIGWALTVSVVYELLPEFGNVLDMLTRPLMIISGAAAPLSVVSPAWRHVLMLNPIAHGVEGVRAAISDYYHAVPELSMSYLYGAALGLILFGLMLQVHFRQRVVSQ